MLVAGEYVVNLGHEAASREFGDLAEMAAHLIFPEAVACDAGLPRDMKNERIRQTLDVTLDIATALSVIGAPRQLFVRMFHVLVAFDRYLMRLFSGGTLLCRGRSPGWR